MSDRHEWTGEDGCQSAVFMLDGVGITRVYQPDGERCEADADEREIYRLAAEVEALRAERERLKVTLNKVFAVLVDVAENVCEAKRLIDEEDAPREGAKS